MPSLKAFFASPFRKGSSPKKNIRVMTSDPIKPSDSESTSSPLTVPTVTTSVRDLPAKEEEEEFTMVESSPQTKEHNFDDFRTTVMASKSKDTCDDKDMDGAQNGDSHEIKETVVEDDDFKTTMMPSSSTESNEPSKETDDNNHSPSERQMDYIISSTEPNENPTRNETKENDIVHNTPFKQQHIEEEDDQDQHESPINSVVFEKHIDTGHSSCSTQKMGSPSKMLLSPLRSPSEEAFHFDDYRSTISGLTEATNFRRLVPPPSPSSIATGTKKMEDFLKTETEAIRQLLSEVDSGDDESTVVEDSIRGANQAETMAREMEREMALLVHGNNNDESKEEAVEKSCNDNAFQVLQDSPGSDQYVTDIRSVMNPSPEDSIGGGDIDNQSLVSSLSLTSNRSMHSPRRDLFRKRSSLYRLKQQKKQRKKIQKKKLRRYVRYFLRTFFATLVLFSAAFVANWKWNFPDQDFSDARKSTMAQLERHATIDPETRAELKAIVVNTTRVTQNYMGSQMQVFATRFDGAKDRVVLEFKETSSYLVDEAKYYAPIIAEQTKTHLIHGLKATNSFATSIGSYVWTCETKSHVLEGFQSANQYVRDRLEYAFTDRAAREKRMEEERRLQELMEAAAAAAAKEAAEHQQQLWTQTMFAGACAFVGSVATNYIWAAL